MERSFAALREQAAMARSVPAAVGVRNETVSSYKLSATLLEKDKA